MSLVHYAAWEWEGMGMSILGCRGNGNKSQKWEWEWLPTESLRMGGNVIVKPAFY